MNTQKTNGTDVVEGTRIFFLDNLRIFMVFLVIACHSGGVYESSGTWASFWIVDDPSTNNLAGLVFLVLDIYVMPTLFFISGFFAPRSVNNRTSRAFLKARFKRLMIPWIIAVLTLIPLYKVIFLYSRNLPQQSWTTYFHWNNGIWSQNWLWFLPVLFVFDVLYLLLSKARIRIPNTSVTVALSCAFVLGLVYSFTMDVLGLRGWTKTLVLDFQNERLMIYFIAFLFGARCATLRVFEAESRHRVLYHVLHALAWIPVTVYVFFLLYPWFRPGGFIISPITDRLIVWFNFHLSLLVVTYATVETFRRYLNRPTGLSNELNRNCLYVYVIHVIVMGLLALSMLHWAMPSLVKYFILTVSTYAISNVLASGLRRTMEKCPFRADIWKTRPVLDNLPLRTGAWWKRPSQTR